MTAKVIKLGRARKAKARAERDVQAAANRVAFGRTGVEKNVARIEAERMQQALGGAKLDD